MATSFSMNVKYKNKYSIYTVTFEGPYIEAMVYGFSAHMAKLPEDIQS